MQNNKNGNKESGVKFFIEGAAVGLALGVAGSMLMVSKTGKAIKKEIKHLSIEFYKWVAPKVKNVKNFTEEEYKVFMKKAAEEFSKARKLSADTAKWLSKEAQNSWKHFSKHSK